ncbi:c-type cytochrome biogenesis protein CcsB [Pseudonocardia sp. TRM90224]|uniref:c-type cytochrome biogenesis protein CcsB n=1 Tax=Pseudonocardia sp. TRM90224 TaxID=2812678 RepID=UPI001E436D90|nr:c-type cytochrome biogenesis protein CcsB [Pseudonocardia sp. TRM90224]
MPTDLAIFSDRLYMATVGVYVLAMILYGIAYSADRSAKAVLVGAAGAEQESPQEQAPTGGRSARFGRMGVALVILGALLHLGSIVARGIAAWRWPLGNMYEFISFICLMAVVGWLVALRRVPAARNLGLFVLTPVVILLFLGGTVLYVSTGPVVPPLQSYWMVIHVTTISASSGLLLVPGVASLLFLVRRRVDARPDRGPSLLDRLPSAEVLDRLAYRVTIVAFPIFTFGLIAGALWAEAAWGRFWGWDPKETVAFISWVIYAAYLHARATAGWRASGAAWVNVAGFASMIFNLFFVNMVIAGLHSYAGLG